ncbi:uncharacterized protein A4U43_C07F25970 [Asparagus officinalis]|uniref:RRM domain-containing protein n=1 Tax=Asparagus officinalis TaxID=4686 RepID=A0A5P1EF13_ASPOF|nr:uncharacterized protein A4U43_C07F25970 [Asparagus officinalis]
MEADDEMAAADADDQDPQSSKENLEVMKQRLKEIEEEAGALQEMHAKVEKDMSVVQDKFGQPKGFAYVEFVEVEAVQNALPLNESELHGHQLKVSAKRTNVPGMKQYRGRRASPYMGFRSRRPYMPPPFYAPFAYGYTILL